MSYRVLARTYRSLTFDEVVGQEPIATTLKNAVESGRVHHGYFFTGTRGVGKTSMARILARALNCLSSDTPTISPCGTCDSCLATAQGEDVDVVEIDAASHTGVDNIRELRNNATLRPIRSRFKIYIIDEVHMLSTAAFNALLKILEEPPSHVKFILATTEAQKVPATIKSRCQRFDFRAIGVSDIAGHLKRILDEEKILADDDVLRRVARLANGSMRDALSLLDKLISYDSQRLTAETAAGIIPPAHDELAAKLMGLVAAQDAGGALRALDEALQSGRTIERFCEDLIEHVRTLMLLCVCGDDTDMVDVPSSVRPSLCEQAARFDAPTFVYMIDLLETLRRQVKTSGAGRALADATVVRLAMSERFTDIRQLLEELPAPDGTSGLSGSHPVEKKNVSEQTPGNSNGDAHDSTSVVTTAQVGKAGVIQKAAKPRGRVSTKEFSRVEQDPWVRKIKEAVDGTLLEVLPQQEVIPSTSDSSPDVE